MATNETLDKLLDVLTSSISDNELLLSIYQSDIAAAIISKRISMNMNQTEFAKHLGVTQGLVSKWESGDSNFTLKTLVDLAQKLSLKLTVKLEEEAKQSYSSTTGHTQSSRNNVIMFPSDRSFSYQSRSDIWTHWESNENDELEEM